METYAGQSENNLITINTDSIGETKIGNNLFENRSNRIMALQGGESDFVSVYIQAYNRLEKTKNCVEAVLKYTQDVDYELILCDNGSTDGTLDYFKSVVHPQKTILHFTKNIGTAIPDITKYFLGRAVILSLYQMTYM